MAQDDDDAIVGGEREDGRFCNAARPPGEGQQTIVV
jgi:hypothetical protein